MIFSTSIVIIWKNGLQERGYSKKLVCKDFLKARAFLRETLLDKESVAK